MAKLECKYKTYGELAEAFRAGVLPGWKLILDNDSCHLAFTGDPPEGSSESEVMDFDDKKYLEGQKLFHGEGYNDLAKAVEALGIPCEWA